MSSMSIRMSVIKMAKIRGKIKVYGRVQGVFFRESAKEKANELNVSCEAFNMPDGTVEIILEGERENVSRVTGWCKTGPPFAKVEKIEIFPLG